MARGQYLALSEGYLFCLVYMTDIVRTYSGLKVYRVNHNTHFNQSRWTLICAPIGVIVLMRANACVMLYARASVAARLQCNIKHLPLWLYFFDVHVMFIVFKIVLYISVWVL